MCDSQRRSKKALVPTDVTRGFVLFVVDTCFLAKAAESSSGLSIGLEEQNCSRIVVRSMSALNTFQTVVVSSKVSWNIHVERAEGFPRQPPIEDMMTCASSREAKSVATSIEPTNNIALVTSMVCIASVIRLLIVRSLADCFTTE